MNIFYLDKDVKKCAEMHVDKHVVKMILEYAQLLSTAHRVIDGTISDAVSKSGRRKKVYLLADSRDTTLYSATHVNHPSAVWVRQSEVNYRTLFNLFCALLEEYTYRYEKTHACTRLMSALSSPPKNIEYKPFTEPTPAMPEEYKVKNDSVKSYRNYYIHDKNRFAKWKNRSVPEWFAEGVKNAQV